MASGVLLAWALHQAHSLPKAPCLPSPSVEGLSVAELASMLAAASPFGICDAVAFAVQLTA